MLTDGLVLAEGSAITNATVAKGASFPTLPDEGELFFRTDLDALHVYNGTEWIAVGLTSSQLDGQSGSYYLNNANATGILDVSKGGTSVSSYSALVTALGLVIGTNVQAFDADLSSIAGLSGTSGLLKKTAANTWALDTSAYLTGNQPITLSGDVSGSGNTNIIVTLATVGTAGTYKSVTVNAKGLVTSGTNPTTLAGFGITDGQPLDGDLTAIAGLTGTAGFLKKTNTNTWELDTSSYLSSSGGTVVGNIIMTGSIIPSANITYDLGSPTMMWKDIYVGPGSIYMNGQKILENVSQTIIFSADDNQNIRIETGGTGNLELLTGAAASILVKSTMTVTSGKRILDSSGIQVEFGDNIEMNANRITGLGAPTGTSDAATKGYVDGLTGFDGTIVRTTGDQTIAGNKTFSGNVTINGAFTSNSTTVLFADNILEFNSDFTTGTPTDDAGFQVRRGDLGIVKFIWDETTDRFTMIDAAGGYKDLYTTGTISAGTFAGNATSATVLSTGRTFSVSGDASGTSATFNGSANATIPLTLASVNSSPATAAFHKITTNTKGLVTESTAVSSTDITTALGYTPVNKAGDTMTGLLVLSGDPVTSFGAVTKQYVDNAVNGLTWKNAVSVSTTTNITLSGTQTIDGIAVAVGDRVLVKNQSTQSQNGVYVVSAGSWTRAIDFDASPTVGEINGAAVFVQNGTVGADTSWVQTSTVTTIGTDSITFSQFGGPGTITAGSNLNLSSNVLSLNTTLTGLTSVTSTSFVGNLTGSATSVPASGLTGTTLASNVVSSSLTSVGTLSSLTVSGTISGRTTGNVAKIGDTMTGPLVTAIGGGVASSIKHITVTNGTNYELFFIPRVGAGAYNSLTQLGDALIGFSGGAIDTGSMVIGPHSASGKGIRIDSSGMVSIGVGVNLNTGTGLTGGLNVNGIITAGSNLSNNGSLILAGYYGSAGAITTLGSEFSTGGPILGYAVRSSTTAAGAFTSTATPTLARSALSLAGDVLKFYTGNSQSVPVGSAVTMSERLVLNQTTMTFNGNNLYVNGASNLLIQHDNADGYIRAQNTGAHLYLGAQSTDTVDITSDGVVVYGTLLSTGNLTAQVITTNATGNGYTTLRNGGPSNTGYIEFVSSSGSRQGYIGNSTSTGSTDTGTILYIAGTHSFQGTVSGTFSGNLTGNVTGNLTGNVTGNASTATTLQTARTIAISGAATGTATSFDGSTNISIPVTTLDASSLSTGTVPVGRLTGTYSINISGNAATATSATTATTAGSATSSGLTSALATYDGTTRMSSVHAAIANGSRTTSLAPNLYAHGLFAEFKDSASIGVSGAYTGLLTFAPYNGTTASTGDSSYQLSFAGPSANAITNPVLRLRAGIDSTWGAWNVVLHSANFNSYAPTLTGTGASGTWGINITGSSALNVLKAGDTMTGDLSFSGGAIIRNSAPTASNAWFSTASYGVSQGDGKTHFGYNSGSGYVNYIRGAITYNDGNVVIGGSVSAANISVAVSANTIVQRDSNGYLFANYLNSTDNSVSSAVTGVMVKAGDNYIRTGTAGSVVSFLGGSTEFWANRGQVSAASQDTATSNGFYLQQDTGASSGLLVTNVGGSLGTLQQRFTYLGEALYRNKTDNTTWNAWKTILSSQNFNSYAPTLTGTGASGTWGINITGNAASSSNTSNITGALGGSYTWTGPNYFTSVSNTSVGFAGQAGNLQAYSNGGAAAMSFHRPGAFAVNMGLDTDNVFRLGGWSDGSASYRFQADTSGNFFVRGGVYPNNGVNYLRSTTSSYGGLEIVGINTSYAGLSLNTSAAGTHLMFDGAGSGGLYNTTDGWMQYWSRTNVCMAIGGTTTTAGFKLNVNGATYSAGNLVTGAGVYSSGEMNAPSMRITSVNPTLTMQDTDNLSAFMHVNSSVIYLLRGSAVNSTSWDGGPNGRHPMTLDMTTGNVTFSGDITAFSDIRLKKNIQTIENALDKVETLHGVTFDHIDQGRGTGLIAQELQQVLPEAVHSSKASNDQEYLTVSYGNTVGLLVQAIKELSAQNKALVARIEALEGK